MPTTPYAKLLAALNGGATAHGAIIAANGDTVQFTAESTAQWDLSMPPRWEIFAYPPGWTGPASGWTTESVPQPGGGSADVYVYLGLGPPPSFDLPALPMWGDFLCKLTVQGGLLNGLPNSNLVDDRTALRIVGPGGLTDIAVSDTGQFDAARAWVGSWQDDLRILDAALVGAATPYTSTPEPIEIGAGSDGVVLNYSKGDHSHPVTVGTPGAIQIGDVASAGGGTALAGAAHVHSLGNPSIVTTTSWVGGTGTSPIPAREDHQHDITFTVVNFILSMATADVDINGKLLTAGGFIAPYFSTNASNPAGTGLLRAAKNTTALAFRDDANAANISAVSMVATDTLAFGATNAAQLRLIVKTGGSIQLYDATTAFAEFSYNAGGSTATVGIGGDYAILDTKELDIDATNIALFGSTGSFGSGDGVVHLQNATTEPTGDASGGLWAWAYGDFLKAKTKALSVLAAPVENGAGSEDLRSHDKRQARAQTIGAVTTTALSYTLPDNCVAKVTAEVVAWTADGGDSAGYELVATFKRFSGGVATQVGSTTVVVAHEDDAALDVAIDTDGANDLRVRPTGVALKTYEWFVNFKVLLMKPA